MINNYGNLKVLNIKVCKKFVYITYHYTKRKYTIKTEKNRLEFDIRIKNGCLCNLPMKDEDFLNDGRCQICKRHRR